MNARIRRQLRALVGAAMFLLFPVLSHALINGGFEVPAVSPPSTGFSVYPSGSGVGWFFDPTKDGTGVSGKNSPFTSGNSLSGAGQVAFITNHGQISQTIFLPAGRHILSLLAVQRMNTQTGPQTLSIAVAGTVVGTITPAAGDLRPFTTDPFTIATTGSYSLTITGTGNTSDTTASSTMSRFIKVNLCWIQ